MRYPFEQNSVFKSPILWGLFISVLLHSAILLLNPTTNTATAPVGEKAPVEITEISPEMIEQYQKQLRQKRKEPQVVETEKLDNEVIDPSATLLSEKNQKAKEQTRAQTIDDFRKKEGSGSKTAKNQNQPPPTAEETTNEENEIDSAEGLAQAKSKSEGVKRDWKSLSLKDLSVFGDGGPLSASDDSLDDVKVGERTILSTREFKYYSYYQRIKELLRIYWKPNVEKRIYKMVKKGQIIRAKQRITQLVVLLKPNGQIEKISKVGTSGMDEIDAAAIEAFQKAAPFPNPPKGIIENDGFVRIRWDFILKTQAAPAITFRRGGRGAGVPN